MKLKLFFLGLFAAAVFISCNNEPIDNGPVGPGGGNEIVPSTGQVSYFTLKMPNRAGTYAGEFGEGGELFESDVYNDVAVFVYNGGTIPEAYAYMASGFTSQITLKVTDGTKKIYVALNLGDATSTLLDETGVWTSTVTSPPDGDDTYSTAFTDLNHVLWTSATPFWALTAPSVATNAVKVDNLLMGLTGSQFSSGNGFIRMYTGEQKPTNTVFFVMANWDNNRIDSVAQGQEYYSTCQYTLAPNVTLAQAQAGANSFDIYVQRAVARASFDMSDVPNGPSAWIYLTQPEVADSLAIGRFTPWGAGSGETGNWVLGNINNETTVFQRFSDAFGGAVSDSKLAVVSADTLPAGYNDPWYQHYDNTRLYGMNKIFGRASVAQVEGFMGTAGNYSKISDTAYQYITENAQPYWTPAKQDNTTYVAIGGAYAPRQWVSAVYQSIMGVTYQGFLYFNDFLGGGPSTQDSVNGGRYMGATEYLPVPYAGGDSDTLYYYEPQKIFIHGMDNVLKYFAWYLRPSAIPPVDQQSLTPQNEQSVIDFYDQERIPLPNATNPNLVAYIQGKCFYRVWLMNPKLAQTPPLGDLPNEQYLIRRNHIYDVNVTKITGPGIGDPNRIIIPGVDVGASPTYMSIQIEIQEFHRIVQDTPLGPN